MIFKIVLILINRAANGSQNAVLRYWGRHIIGGARADPKVAVRSGKGFARGPPWEGKNMGRTKKKDSILKFLELEEDRTDKKI